MTQKKNKLKSPLFRIVCYLLVLNVLFMGITFARYISTTNPDPTVNVSAFACSIDIGESSGSFIFRNSDYDHDGTVMNTPQITTFTVKNYRTESDGSKTVAGVDIKYSLVFYVPQNFAKSAAIQITKKDSGGSDVAVTPLYVLNDFLTKSSFTTYGGYGSIGTLQQTFNQKYAGFFSDGNGNTITVENETSKATVMRAFPAYYGTIESGRHLLPHLYLETTEEVAYYKITITNSAFATLKAGAETAHTYQLRLVPTSGMSHTDDQLDDEFNSLEASTIINNSKLVNKMEGWTVNYTGGTLTMTNTNTNTTYGDTQETKISLEKCDGKSYPCRLNAIFEQASTAS